MKQRTLKPRFEEIYFAQGEKKGFYRTIGHQTLEYIEAPFERWQPTYLGLHMGGKTVVEELIILGWTGYDLEAFKDKFKNLPIFLDNEEKNEYFKQKKIKNYKIRKEKIMKGGYRH